MTDGITKASAYTAADRLKLASVFFGVTVAALWLSVAYWRAIGVL